MEEVARRLRYAPRVIQMIPGYDSVVLFQVTSPFRMVQDIENLIEKKLKEDWEVVFSVVEARRNPYFNMVKLEEDGRAVLVCPSHYTARQQAPKIYDMNASLYAYSLEFLRSGKHLFEGRCGIIEMMDTGVLDLGREHDFELMQVVAEHLLAKIREQFRDIDMKLDFDVSDVLMER